MTLREWIVLAVMLGTLILCGIFDGKPRMPLSETIPQTVERTPPSEYTPKSGNVSQIDATIIVVIMFLLGAALGYAAGTGLRQ